MQSAMDNAKDDATKEALSGDYTAAASKLKQLEADLRDFCKQTRRRNDTFRQQVHGFGRSEAQRAVQAAKWQRRKPLTALRRGTPSRCPLLSLRMPVAPDKCICRKKSAKSH